ncbi:MAG: hypothetical protein KC619_16435 [Myxococcales bacterium]|nr:hypothetical protein [Myxococcales bacterium]
MRRLLAALLLLALPAGAEAQGLRAPARVQVTALFGEGTLIADGWSTVLVEVENRTRGDQHGTVQVDVGDYRGTHLRRALPLDVPGGQTRSLRVPLFTGSAGSVVHARFEVDGRVLARGERSVDYAPSERSVVVFSDPPRLRGALLDLDVETYTSSGERQVRFPVGTVRFDPATSDPLLPETAAEWSTVRLLVASAPVLARVSAPQRAAIEDWLRAGGTLLVFPRSEADFRLPWLVSLAGEIALDGPTPSPDAWVPPVATFPFRCTGDQRTWTTGCGRRVGHGFVHVAAYDGESPAAIETGAPRAFIASFLSRADEGLALRFARGSDDLDQRYWTQQGSFGSLRAALDPNQGFRPALVLVALALLFYVILVGPVNFRWVAKKNRPTLALVTTPLAASACVLVLLTVGYLGKGVTMRYRRVEVAEALEGETRAFARRYTGLFSTRPGTFDLPLADPNAMTHRIGGGSGDPPLQETRGSRDRLSDFRAGLWETTFLREDRVFELGGTIGFEREGERLIAVRNETGQRLEGAFVIDTAGSIYPVGDLDPGTRAEIPRTSRRTVSRHFLIGPDSDAPRVIAGMARLDADDSDERARVRGLIHLLGDRFVPTDAPVLYARLPATYARIGDVFTAEVDQRWLRLAPMPRDLGAWTDDSPEAPPDPTETEALP